jgi:hypothetical protein
MLPPSDRQAKKSTAAIAIFALEEIQKLFCPISSGRLAARFKQLTDFKPHFTPATIAVLQYGFLCNSC